MLRLRQFLAALLAYTFFVTSLTASPVNSLGTLVYAEGARVGTSAASVGSTIFGGDLLSTDQSGSLQVRTAAARFRLQPASNAIFLQDPGAPAAILTKGTGIFSTSNANAFALHALQAVIKANSNAPTIGQVTVVSANELLVQSTRGALACTVDGETRVINEGEAYRLVLESADAGVPEQGPRGSGSGRAPRRAGKNIAVYIYMAIVAIPTILLLHEALESADRP